MTGLGGRPGVGAQLVDRRQGVGGEDAERRFFFAVERLAVIAMSSEGSKVA